MFASGLRRSKGKEMANQTGRGKPHNKETGVFSSGKRKGRYMGCESARAPGRHHMTPERQLADDCGSPGRSKGVTTQGGSHIFPIDSPDTSCSTPPPVAVDIRPRRRSPRLHNHPGPSVKHTKSIQSFVSSLSCPPESQPTLSSPEMSLQSTLVKIALDSPQFARFLHRQQSPRVVSFPRATYYPTMRLPNNHSTASTFPKFTPHPLVI